MKAVGASIHGAGAIHSTEIIHSTETTRLIKRLVQLVETTGCTVATAESLTGGHLAAAIASAPDASRWYRGGVVAYHAEVKYTLLDVPRGPVVTAESAEAMARSACSLLGADCAVSLTGVGGPEVVEGEPPGTVYLAVCSGDGAPSVSHHRFEGEPINVMSQAVEAALEALIERIAERSTALKPPH